MNMVTVVGGMTAEQSALVAAVADFADAELAPNAVKWDQTSHFPVDVLAKAGELGLGAVYVQEEFGGSNLTRQDACLIFEELAKGDTTIAAYISIHNMVVWMIDSFGSVEQRAQWVPALATMQALGSYCLTEPDAGSDAGAIRTAAVRDGDDYVVTGVKQFISGAGSSAVYVVMARTSDDGPRGISAFIVPDGSPGLSFGPSERKMGWNAQPTRQVIFDGVRIPAGNRLGEEGDGFMVAMRGLNGGRLNMAACSIGGAQWALERTIEYVKERQSFGVALASHQALVFEIADMETKLQAARALLHVAARNLDDESADAVAKCAMAKRFATDVAFEVANSALQLHGGYGYLAEYGIEKVVRDLRVHQILEGTNEIMKVVVGRALLGRP